MHNVRLVYCSAISQKFQPQDIDRILQSSRQNNQALGICGMLCFNSDFHFLQCLEGERKAVNQLYEKILKDPRHKDALLLDYREISEPLFKQWNMGYLPTALLDDPDIQAHLQQNDFKPEQLSADQAHELVLLLYKRLPKL